MEIPVRKHAPEDPDTISVQALNALLENGFRANLLFHDFGLRAGGYTIDGVKYPASALSLGGETFVREKGDALVVPTFFRRFMLATGGEGDPEELIRVEAVIDPQDIDCVSIHS